MTAIKSGDVVEFGYAKNGQVSASRYCGKIQNVLHNAAHGCIDFVVLCDNGEYRRFHSSKIFNVRKLSIIERFVLWCRGVNFQIVAM